MYINKILIVNNYKINKEDFEEWYKYFLKEKEYNDYLPQPPCFEEHSTDLQSNIITKENLHNINEDIKKITSSDTKDTKDISITAEELITMGNKIVDIFDVNPLDEIISIFEFIREYEECRPQFFMLLALTYNGAVISYITLLKSDKTKFKDTISKVEYDVLFYSNFEM
jgi:hypothetical protein